MIMAVIILLLGYAIYYLITKSKDLDAEISRQEMQIAGLLKQYNDNNKKISDIQEARLQLKILPLGSVESVCKLLDGL